jgi:hypothetical protein
MTLPPVATPAAAAPAASAPLTGAAAAARACACACPAARLLCVGSVAGRDSAAERRARRRRGGAVMARLSRADIRVRLPASSLLWWPKY